MFRDHVTVDAQKDINHGECDALIAIDERMVLDQAFQERRSFVNERIVISGLRTMQSRLERACITNSRGAAVATDQLLVEKKSIGHRDVFRHLASDRYNSSCAFRLSSKASRTLRR